MELTCHCGTNSYAFLVATPLENTFTDIKVCQCIDCRLQTGNFASWFVQAPNQPFDIQSVPTTLTAYKINATLTHYFCNTCSSQLFRWEQQQDSEPGAGFGLFTPCLKLPRNHRFTLNSVCSVERASDGIIASWLPGIKCYDTDGVSLTEEFIRGLESIDYPLKGEISGNLGNKDEGDQSNASTDSHADELIGKCHCSNIKIQLSRPTGSQAEKPPFVYSDNTDLVIPNWTLIGQQPPIDNDNPWWIREGLNNSEAKRFLGGTCTCDSCRVIAGTEVQSWVFIPTPSIHLILPTGEIIPWPSRESLINGSDERVNEVMGIYKSTPGDPGVTRGFCKTCGANIFWDGFTRKNLIDLSGGLFTVNGTKRKDWIEWWTYRTSFVEDVKGTSREEIGLLLEKGLQEWRTRSSAI
ncbi:hypothetical protein TWF718_005325 [Orbilia javanica]|uniref:CENP-V/GFA domain-containing protein n=1 Tax=Orbilia javanica TaxID=47235 RepID=A0AAN8RIR4_9PEZI